MFVNGPISQMLSIVTVLILFLQRNVVDAANAGKLIGDLRVVGGTDANELPTLAFSTGSKLCAATLIHSEYVKGYRIQPYFA